MKASTPTVTSSSVADVQPILFNETNAAKYLGRTKSWLRNQRAIDKVRWDEDGLPPAGPSYIVMGSRSIYYKVADLDAWIAQNSERPPWIDAANAATEREVAQ